MYSVTIPSPSVLVPHLTHSFIPHHFFSFSYSRRVQPFAVISEQSLVLRHGCSFRKGNCDKGLYWSCSRFLRRCKNWGGDFSSLEAEILEFMRNSDNPEAFPTKEELVAAGRVDLVEAIVNKGGWLAFGWDLNKGSLERDDFDDGSGSEIDGNETRVSGIASLFTSSANSSQPAKSVEIEAGESGIEGILKRLEKQRSNSFGHGFGEKEDSISPINSEDKEEWDHRTTKDAVAADLDNSSRPSTLNPTSSPLGGFKIKLVQHRSQLGPDDLRGSLKPETWRSWVLQRTGFSDADFEDAEIVPSETQKGGVSDVSKRPEILKTREFSCEPTNRETGLDSVDGIGHTTHSDIKYRIQHLQSELSSALHSLRSRTKKVTMQMEQKNSYDDLAKLSDDWEFQENEIMNAQDRLRSLRAKLAVLEGKMAMAIMDAHRVVEEKQRKINNAQQALKFLKTTCVVWPNTASEVFLAGSFDGWSTQNDHRRITNFLYMNPADAAQLYPGKYEIKFIVDGEWRIDPLRPVVNNNGYENNLLLIHDV